MIYLIESSAFKRKEDETIEYFQLLKIGYTDDSNRDIRYSQYKMHNPTFKVLKEILGGTEEHEKALHYKFRDLKYIGREWFKYDQSIIDYFNNLTLENINSLLNVIEQDTSGDSRRVKISKIREILKLVFSNNYEINDWIKKVENEFQVINLTVDGAVEYLERCGIDLSIVQKMKSDKFIDDEKSNKIISNFIAEIDKFKDIPSKLKYITLNRDKITDSEFDIILLTLKKKLRDYIAILGLDGVKACGYNISDMKKEIEKILFDPSKLSNYIYSVFNVGEKFTLADIKKKLANLYSSIGYNSVPKATDIRNYFDVREVLLNVKQEDGSRKRVRGYELLAKKF